MADCQENWVDAYWEPVWVGKSSAVEHADRLRQPLQWVKPRRVLVGQVGDIFHEAVSSDYIEAVFAAMALAKQHTFLVVTRHPERMLDWFSHSLRPGMVAAAAGQDLGNYFKQDGSDWPGWPLPNVWIGVAVDDQATANQRIPALLRAPAAVRWVFMRPLQGPVSLRWLPAWPENAPTTAMNPYNGGQTDHLDGLRRLDWIVVGGESGDEARPLHPDWVRGLRDQCIEADVPFCFTGWGEWVPICQLTEDEIKVLYRSNRRARKDQDQATLDELYGKYCIVPTGIFGVDGRVLGICEPEAFLASRRPMQVFRIAKRSVGLTLDGRRELGFPRP